MLRDEAQKAISGEGLVAEDAPLSTLTDLPNQVAAATAPSLRGTAANDLLRGTNDDELIQGLAGNDTLIGRRGADRLLGQAGDDSLIGGGGEDTLIGAGGNDRLKGGGGSDSLKGGGGDDTLLGGGGADTLKGGGGEDSLNGGGGGDLLVGGGKSDTLDGSRGDDTLKGGGGGDLILGGVGNDEIDGGRGADTIRYRDADFARSAVDTIIGFKTGEDKIDLTNVTIPAEGLGFVVIDGSIALEIGGGRLVFRGVADPSLLSADDFLLPDGAPPISFMLPTLPPPVAENRAPIVSAAVERGSLETDPAFTVDLLSGASDLDEGDQLTVNDLSLISGDASGISFVGAALEVDPAAYQRLAAGAAETIRYAYTISDTAGASVAQTAIVTIFGRNDAPVTTGPLIAMATEDDANFIIDLLAGATDADASANLSIDGLTLLSGDDRGVVSTGATLAVDPGAYNDLGADEVEVIVFGFNVTDGVGGVAAQTATITINGRNDAPTVAAEIRGGGVAGSAAFSIDLLGGASDADANDILAISGLRFVSGDASGIRESGGELIVDPSAYAGLGGGQGEEIVYAYDIVDGSGASIQQTATITIAGANDAPSVPVQLNAEASEDDASFVIDLLEGASDPDTGDLLSVANFALLSGDPAGVGLAGNRLNIDPGAYNRLSAGAEEAIAFRYDVTDGKGGTAAQFVAITITGANDAPVALPELRQGGSESGGDFTVNLLDDAEDPDEDDVLTVQGVTLTSGDGSGIVIGASSLSVDVSAYESLSLGEVETIRYSYQISDGAGGSVSRAVQIAIVGENSAPVVNGPATVTADELDAPIIFNFLQGAFDPDRGDAISIANLTLTAGDTSGVTIVGDTLSIDPGLYGFLIAGEEVEITYAYDLIDGNGGVTPQTAAITIEGLDEFREVSDSSSGTEIEGTSERDRIFGRGGNDTISGGAGDDEIFGGADNDVINTSVGKDRLSGGEGRDEFVIRFADEDNELLDTTPDIITDFNLLLDTLDFRKVIGGGENFADLIRITKDEADNSTTISILETDVVILEGLSLTRKNLLDEGVFAFESANFHFEDNPFGFQNQALADGPKSEIPLPLLEDGECYKLNDFTSGGTVILSGDEISLDPKGNVIVLDPFGIALVDPIQGGIVTASVSHFDKNNLETKTDFSWEIRPDDQEPTFSGRTFAVSDEATEFRWDLTDFVVDDFFMFDASDEALLKFDIVIEPAFGTVVIDALGETFLFLEFGSAEVRKNEAATAIFTLGDDFLDVLEDESVSVDIEFAVRDNTFSFVYTTFTIEVRGSAEVTASGDEAGGAFILDLLQGVSGAGEDGGISVANLTRTGGDDSGVLIAGDTLSVDPSFYRSLILGEQEVITYAYDLIDENGGIIPQVAEIRIDGADDLRSVFDSDEGAEIQGAPERDEIFGNGGDDTINGGGGDDIIFGGADNDVISTSAGVDRLSGGAGQDRFLLLAEDGEIDLDADIITDFDLQSDKLDFRDVLKEAENFDGFVSFAYDPILDQTAVDILGTEVVILERISQTFQEMFGNGNFVFHDPNTHFDDNGSNFFNQAIAGGLETAISLPFLEEGEFYQLDSSSGGGFVTLIGEEVFLDPTGILLGPNEIGQVTASISHFDSFGIKATAEATWDILPDNQPPTFFDGAFNVFQDAIDVSWNLNDFADDDFVTFDSSPTTIPLEFSILTEPAFGTVDFNGSDVTFTLEDDFRDLRRGEIRSVDIEFEVTDAEGESASATFTVEVLGDSVPLFVDSGGIPNQLLFSGDFDTYEVLLDQGIEYAFQARGRDTGEGSLSDPALTLLDDNFSFIDQDDNSGAGANSLIRFTADRSGFFFLQVDAADEGAGGYVIEATQDDFSNTIDTFEQIFPGETVFGVLETPGDLDVISIFLLEGINYQFDLLGQPSGAGTLFDPFLSLQDRNGEELASNDNHFDFSTGGGSLESQIVFTPTQSDTYFLVVETLDPQFTGSWLLLTNELF